MIAEPKFKPHQDDNDRDKRERRRQEEALDEALSNNSSVRSGFSRAAGAARHRSRHKDLKDDERVRGAGQLLSTPPWITMPNLRAIGFCQANPMRVQMEPQRERQ